MASEHYSAVNREKCNSQTIHQGLMIITVLRVKRVCHVFVNAYKDTRLYKYYK